MIFEPLITLYFYVHPYLPQSLRCLPVLDLKGVHSGSDIFILGNGPSLAQVDFERLVGHITLASNKIFLAFDKTTWRPTYYTVEDDLVLQQNIGNISCVDAKKIMPSSSLLYSGKINGAEYFKYKQQHHYPDRPNFCTSDTFYWGSTVVYTQIQLAKYMGAKRIILLGVDFSFDVPKSASSSTKEITSEGECNHFHADYRKPGEKWNIPNLQNQILAFEAAKEACDRDGVEIFNAAKGSKLDVFLHDDLERFLQP